MYVLRVDPKVWCTVLTTVRCYHVVFKLIIWRYQIWLFLSSLQKNKPFFQSFCFQMMQDPKLPNNCSHVDQETSNWICYSWISSKQNYFQAGKRHFYQEWDFWFKWERYNSLKMHPQNIIGVGNPPSWSVGLNGIVKESSVFWKPSVETGHTCLFTGFKNMPRGVVCIGGVQELQAHSHAVWVLWLYLCICFGSKSPDFQCWKLWRFYKWWCSDLA